MRLKKRLIRLVVRTRFRLTSRRRAARAIDRLRNRYLTLAGSVGVEEGRRSVTVPPMLGVDPDMRDWSLFQILEHNAIVNRSMAELVDSLAHGRTPTGGEVKDPKRDVMPSAEAGPEQIEAFDQSVSSYLEAVEGFPGLRRTRPSPHPVFGPLDAHGWHCMIALHLEIHLKQAQTIVDRLKAAGPAA